MKPRLLGLDYGEKRIGVAVSDPLWITAQAVDKIEYATEQQWKDQLQGYLKEYKPGTIVVGLPLKMDGTDTAQTQKTREFCEKLKQLYDIPIETFDERLTSRGAEGVLIASGMRRDKRKQKIDALAAQMMLQTYMQRHAS